MSDAARASRRFGGSGTPARRTAILSKQPVPGEVKTRLCPPLAASEAAALAEAMLRDAVERCRAVAGWRTTLWFAPASAGAWFERAFPGLELRPQVGAGLGKRLAAAFAEGLAAADTMVAIGSDQPMVSTATIDSAHRALEEGADVVLGPDAGGGYVLVGLRATFPELFTEVEMSTPDMCAATVARAEQAGRRVALLPPGYDVDVEEDLARLRADLARADPTAPDYPRHTAACLRALSRPARHGPGTP